MNMNPKTHETNNQESTKPLIEQAQRVGDLAMLSAQHITRHDPVNMRAAEMHLRALTGLFGGALNPAMYDKLGQPGKDAIQEAADETVRYFVRSGQISAVSSGYMRDVVGPLYGGQGWRVPDYEANRYLVEKLQNHVMTLAGQTNSTHHRVPAALGSASQVVNGVAQAVRLRSEPRYNQDDVRQVVTVFGSSLGVVATELAAVYPDGSVLSDAFRHAQQCLEATLPNRAD